MTWKATYKIAVVTDTRGLIIDQDGPRPVTPDDQGVINRIAASLIGARTLPSLKASNSPDQGENHNHKGATGCSIT